MRGEHCYSLDTSTSTRDHPRMRGEHIVTQNLLDPVCRITPACAGSTVPSSFIALTVRDHPRMRGEHVAPKSKYTKEEGSPPHARGAP